MRITDEGLRRALAAHLGSVLTPEVAASIHCAAIDREDRAIRPDLFKPETRGSLTFAAESIRDILPELTPLHLAHFSETERHLAGMAMAPDYDYVFESERMGRLVQFTARNAEGELVGNLRMYIHRSLHTGNLFADEDAFYLSPSARRGRNAINFLRYVETGLQAVVGVREFRASTKTVNGTDRLLAHMGYRHVANQMIKILGGNDVR